MEFGKIIKRGIIIALAVTLISMAGMGILDFYVFLVIGLLVLIAAGISTLVNNQSMDK